MSEDQTGQGLSKEEQAMIIRAKYETDFYGWAQDQSNLLRNQSFEELDVPHLIAEIEGLGKAQVEQLHDRLELLLLNLLKWQYLPKSQHESWMRTVREPQRRIGKYIQQNPSIKSQLGAILTDSYEDARYGAVLETGLCLDTFPIECPWTFEQVMDSQFWPD